MKIITWVASLMQILRAGRYSILVVTATAIFMDRLFFEEQLRTGHR